ncbi:hypothetical protein JCM10212_004909 [Sporobolomyces blumeae]
MLAARKRIKEVDQLDDSTPIKRLVSIAIKRGYDDVAVRLIDESVRVRLARHESKMVQTGGSGGHKKKTTVWMYIDACQQLGRLRRWSTVVDLTNQALRHGLVSPTLLQVRMRALNRRSRYVDTIATWRLYDEHGLERDGPAYDEVIEAYLLNADLPTAQAIQAEKSERGFPTTVHTCLSLFDGMALYGGNRAMEERVLRDASEEALAARTAIRQDVRVLNKILSVRTGRDATRDALAMLDYFNLGRFPRGLFDKFRALAPAAAFATPDEHMSPLNLDHWKPRPDRATIVSLAGLALRQRRPALATELLSSKPARRFKLNDHLVASIVRTLITEGSISAAEEFVFALPFGKARFNDHRYRAFEPGSFVYETLLAGVLRFRGLAGMTDCFRRLVETDQPPLKANEGLTRALVDYLALEKMEKLDISVDLLVKVKEITRGRTRPTRENLDTLLKAAWQTERLSLHGWTKMRKALENEFPIPNEDDGPKPPPRPLPALAGVLVPRGARKSPQQRSSLERLEESFASRRIVPSVVTSENILRHDHLIRFISAKWDYLQSQVLDLGVRPTHYHLVILIRAYLALGDVKGAFLALRYALDEARLEPHIAFFSTLISGLSRSGQHDLALEVYDEMRRDHGFQPDRQMFAALAMSCSRVRDLDGLDRVLDEAKHLVENSHGRTLDPALLAQAQQQARIRIRKAKGRVGAPSSDDATTPSDVALPYDPMLDPVFLTIYYRALNSLGRHLDAQVLVRLSLDRGLVPDLIVYKVLSRTGTWNRWKENRETKQVGATPEHEKVEREEAVEVWRENLERVTRMVKKTGLQKAKRDLARITQYWEKVEQGAKDEREWDEFFADVGHGKGGLGKGGTIRPRSE